jgi:hypothetical protein
MYQYFVHVADGANIRSMPIVAPDEIFAEMKAEWWCKDSDWRVIGRALPYCRPRTRLGLIS